MAEARAVPVRCGLKIKHLNGIFFIQGGLFNWPPPKNHKFEPVSECFQKKLEYPDWPPPKSSKCQPVSNFFLRKS